MRRSASEVVNDLELRVARLERRTSSKTAKAGISARQPEEDSIYIEKETDLDLSGAKVNMYKGKTTFEKGFFIATVGEDRLISIRPSDESPIELRSEADLKEINSFKKDIAEDWAQEQGYGRGWNTQVKFYDLGYVTEGPFNETGSILFFYGMVKITSTPMLSMSVNDRKTRNKDTVEDRAIAVFSYSLRGEMNYLGLDRSGKRSALREGLVGDFTSNKVFSSI